MVTAREGTDLEGRVAALTVEQCPRREVEQRLALGLAGPRPRGHGRTLPAPCGRPRWRAGSGPALPPDHPPPNGEAHAVSEAVRRVRPGNRRPDHHPGAPGPEPGRGHHHHGAVATPANLTSHPWPYDGCSAAPERGPGGTSTTPASTTTVATAATGPGAAPATTGSTGTCGRRARSCTRAAASSDGPATASPPSTTRRSALRGGGLRPPPGGRPRALKTSGPGPRRAGPRRPGQGGGIGVRGGRRPDASPDETKGHR